MRNIKELRTDITIVEEGATGLMLTKNFLNVNYHRI